MVNRREFVGAMAALFGGVVIQPYRESLIIRPDQALWVPIQGQYTRAELSGILKRVYSEPSFRQMSAEQIVLNSQFRRVLKIESKRAVFFKHAPEPYRSLTQKWGSRKTGTPEIIVMSKQGVIEGRREA